MPYEPMTFDVFRQRLHSGRYKNRRAARIALNMTGLDLKVRAEALALAESYFLRRVGGLPRASVRSLTHPSLEGGSLAQLLLAAEHLATAASLIQVALEGLDLQPVVTPPTAATAAMLALTEEDEDDDYDPDAEEDAAPDVAPVVVIPQKSVVVALTPRRDLEKAMEEIDADPRISEKEKESARDFIHRTLVAQQKA